MNWTVRIALVFTLLPIAPGIAGAQTASPPAGVTEAVSILSPIDNNFVAQAIWASRSKSIPAELLRRRPPRPTYATMPT
jgi:hypothetical protein